MNITRLIICSIFFFVPTVTTFSQGLWKKAEVVLKDGSRLTGMVIDREWVVNPSEIEFREDGKETRVLTVNEIQEFSIDRPIKYKAVAVTYDGDGQLLDDLPPLREPSKVVSEVRFVEVLVDSRFSLYFLQEKNGRKHFFINENGVTKELLDRWYGAKLNAQHFAFYKQQLTLITNDCAQLQAQTSKIHYNESDLSRFFHKLNECKKAEVHSPWSGPSVTIKKRPAFGISTQLFFSQIDFAFIQSDMSSPNFGLGVFGEFYDHKKPNRFSFFGELSYQKIDQSEIKYQLAGALIATRISFPERSGERHYLMMGLNNTYRFNAEFDYPYNWARPEETNEYILGLALGAGKSFSLFSSLRINAELRYTYDRWHSGSTGFNGAHNVGLGLQFYPKK